jgi:hypothetical protein
MDNNVILKLIDFYFAYLILYNHSAFRNFAAHLAKDRGSPVENQSPTPSVLITSNLKCHQVYYMETLYVITRKLCFYLLC